MLVTNLFYKHFCELVLISGLFANFCPARDRTRDAGQREAYKKNLIELPLHQKQVINPYCRVMTFDVFNDWAAGGLDAQECY